MTHDETGNMSDKLRPAVAVFRDANIAFNKAWENTKGSAERVDPSNKAAAAVIRTYGDQRDADAYQRGKLEGARLALEAISLIVHDQDRETVAALSPAKIVGEG